MILDLLVEVLEWIIVQSLNGLGAIIPENVWSMIDGFTAAVTAVLKLGPVGLVGILFTAHAAVNLALNAYVFAIEAYRLMPAKAT